jgi:DNA-binding NarL/FixJ family response regulator
MYNSHSNVRVFIASEQQLLLQGIKSILDAIPGFSVCGTSLSPDDFKNVVSALGPDLIIIDRKLGDFFSEENLNLNDQFLSLHKVLMISDFDKESIYHLHKIHIQGFITTQADQEELVGACRAILAGGKYFSAKVVEVLIEMSFHKQAPKKLLHEDLSGREMEIFKLVSLGKSTKEIADDLCLSMHTVYTHRKNILKKLSCKSASELINYAYAQGLVEKD